MSTVDRQRLALHIRTNPKLATHEAEADPHPQYATDDDLADHAATPHGGTGTSDHGALTGLGDDDHPQYQTASEVDGLITVHAGAADPHPVYATDANLTAHTAIANAHHSEGHSMTGSMHVGALNHGALAFVDADQHHYAVHEFASGSALGAYHTMSGATAGDVLRALTATTAAFDRLAHADLTIVAGDNHHAQAHAIDGADHTGSITAAQHPSIATGNLHPEYETPAEVDARIATHAGAADPHPTYQTATEVDGKITVHEGLANPHPGYATDDDLTAHALTPHGGGGLSAHELANGTGLGTYHTISGATAGDVLRALTATTAAFDKLAHADLTIVAGDNHHAQAHAVGGADHTGTITAAQHPSIATGNLHPEYVEIAGDTMTGTLTAPTVRATTLGGNTTVQNANDGLYLSNGTNINFFLDQSVTGGQVIVGFNTPKAAVQSTPFSVYNNATDHNSLFSVVSKGTGSGADAVNVNALFTPSGGISIPASANNSLAAIVMPAVDGSSGEVTRTNANANTEVTVETVTLTNPPAAGRIMIWAMCTLRNTTANEKWTHRLKFGATTLMTVEVVGEQGGGLGEKGTTLIGVANIANSGTQTITVTIQRTSGAAGAANSSATLMWMIIPGAGTTA